MVFVIFDGIVFCNKSCFEKNDFFYWNCCNWWCFPLWIININWIKYCYRQNIEKYSNYHTKSCFLNCEFKIWFHFGIPNHVFMISHQNNISSIHGFCYFWRNHILQQIMFWNHDLGSHFPIILPLFYEILTQFNVFKQ